LEQFTIVIVAAGLSGSSNRWSASFDTVQGTIVESLALAINDVAFEIGRKATNIEFGLRPMAWTSEKSGGKVVRI
jgi:hypothetical protein